MKPHFCLMCGEMHTWDESCRPEAKAEVAARREEAFQEILAEVRARPQPPSRPRPQYRFSYMEEVMWNDPWWDDNR